MAHADDGIPRSVDLKQPDPAARRDDSPKLLDHWFNRNKVSERESGNRHREARIGEREAEGIALQPETESRRPFVRRHQHPTGEIEADRFGSEPPAMFRKVPGPAGKVQNPIARPNFETAHEISPPALIGAEGHEPIDAVIARRDAVEHRAHRGCFFVWGRKDAHNAAHHLPRIL